MKVTVFTSNQPRHLNLVKELSSIFSKVCFVCEANTVFPGSVPDFFAKSDVMQTYFCSVKKAEHLCFGEGLSIGDSVETIVLKMGDLQHAKFQHLASALDSDVYIIFGSSYIRGWLAEYLIERRAVNIHMGLSPYYRGSSCNFWALFDRRPECVGATIHWLGRGLDSGDIISHCLPKPVIGESGFNFSMRAVVAVQLGLVDLLSNSAGLSSLDSVPQKKAGELRYSKNSEFCDSVAKQFLERGIVIKTADLDYPELVNPFRF